MTVALLACVGPIQGAALNESARLSREQINSEVLKFIPKIRQSVGIKAIENAGKYCTDADERLFNGTKSQALEEIDTLFLPVSMLVFRQLPPNSTEGVSIYLWELQAILRCDDEMWSPVQVYDSMLFNMGLFDEDSSHKHDSVVMAAQIANQAQGADTVEAQVKRVTRQYAETQSILTRIRKIIALGGGGVSGYVGPFPITDRVVGKLRAFSEIQACAIHPQKEGRTRLIEKVRANINYWKEKFNPQSHEKPLGRAQITRLEDAALEWVAGRFPDEDQ
jgi:hypothetical protein